MRPRRLAVTVMAMCYALGAVIPIASGQSGATAGSDAPRVSTAIEDEVLENLRRQELGRATVRDLKLPEPFLRRVADRVIRTTFRERYRVVIARPNLPASGNESTSTEGSSDERLIGPSATLKEVSVSEDRPSMGSRVVWWAGGFVLGVAAAYVALLRRGRRA